MKKHQKYLPTNSQTK